MSARYRRRRYLVGRFQYTLLGFTLLYLTAILLTVVAVAVWPFLFATGASPEQGAQPLGTALGVLFLHERLWPILLPVVLLVGVHSVIVSHRIAGPLVRLRAVMKGASEGDLATRAVLRHKDYLWEEAHALNRMLDGLGGAVARVEARAGDLERVLVRLHAVHDGESPRVATEEVEEQLARLRAALCFFRTAGADRDAEPDAEGRLETSEPRRARRAGFTLVELAIVVAILATLCGLGLVAYRRAIHAAREMVAIVEIRDLQEAIDLYEMRNGALPLTLADLEPGPRIDPWGHPYEYLNFSTLPGAVGGGVGGGGGGQGGGGGKGGGGGGGNDAGGGSGGGGGGGGDNGGGGNGGDSGGGNGGNGNGGGGGNGHKRKDRFIVPINSTYDLYSVGPDGESVAPLTAAASRDDILRANDGEFIGPARKY